MTNITLDAQRGELPPTAPLPLCGALAPVAGGFVSPAVLPAGGFELVLLGGADFTFVSELTAVPPAGFADCVAPVPAAFWFADVFWLVVPPVLTFVLVLLGDDALGAFPLGADPLEVAPLGDDAPGAVVVCVFVSAAVPA